MGYWKDTFFAGWTQGIKEGITFEDKIVLTLRIIKNSFLGLWLFHIKPKLTEIVHEVKNGKKTQC